MECHVFPQFRPVSRTEAIGAFAPIGRIGNPDRIAAAIVLDDAVFLEHGEIGIDHIFGEVAGAGFFKSGRETFLDGFFGIEKILRRLAQEHRARQRAVIAAIAAGNLEEGPLARFHRTVVPGQMGRGCIRTGGKQRHDRRIVPAVVSVTAGPGIVDLRDEVAFAHARFHRIPDAPVHLFHDAAGNAHVIEFPLRFDRSLPVHQTRCVLQFGIRKIAEERHVGGSRKIVIVEFDTDLERAPAAIGHDRRQKIHGMPIGRLHVVVGIAQDMSVIHVDRALRAVAVLQSAVPERFIVQRDKHALVNVEGPAVIGRQPGHVGRIRHNQELYARILHSRTHLREPAPVFLNRERKLLFGCIGHQTGPPVDVTPI